MSGFAPASPRLASTVILLRDEAAGLTVFMVRRSEGAGFMAGAHVFPGGRVDKEDRSPTLLQRCSLAAAAAAQTLEESSGEVALSLYVAAMRELFEESGVLLAHDSRGLAVDSADEPFSSSRAALHAGSLDFGAFVESQDLRLLASELHYFARWITPELEPKRFDAYFFLAAAPANSKPRHDAHETVESCWLRPADALELARDGKIQLPPPTMKTLELLAPLPSTSAALEWANRWRPRTVCPELEIVGETPAILLPGDPLSRVQERAYPGPTRYLLKDGAWQGAP